MASVVARFDRDGVISVVQSRVGDFFDELLDRTAVRATAGAPGRITARNVGIAARGNRFFGTITCDHPEDFTGGLNTTIATLVHQGTGNRGIRATGLIRPVSARMMKWEGVAHGIPSRRPGFGGRTWLAFSVNGQPPNQFLFVAWNTTASTQRRIKNFVPLATIRIGFGGGSEPSLAFPAGVLYPAER